MCHENKVHVQSINLSKIFLYKHHPVQNYLLNLLVVSIENSLCCIKKLIVRAINIFIADLYQASYL